MASTSPQTKKSTGVDAGASSAAPLTDDEVRRYIDATFYPLLKVMTLVDSYAWQLYDPPGRELMRQETLAAFDHVAALIGLSSTQ